MMLNKMNDKIEKYATRPNQKLVRVRWDNYMVHFDITNPTIIFEVYPVVDYYNSGDTEKGILYTSIDDSEIGLKEFKEDKCLMKLSGSFCWRGVWEGRLYFPDNEYWGEELEELSCIYNTRILTCCQVTIRGWDSSIKE